MFRWTGLRNNECGMPNNGETYLHPSELDESRHSHTQRMAAMIRAIQFRPIGIVSVPTVTWVLLINRRRCPIAKMPKKTLATRNPVLGEFMSGLLKLRGDLSATMRVL